MDAFIADIPQWVIISIHLVTFVTVLYIAYKAIRIFRLSWKSKNEQSDYFRQKLDRIDKSLAELKSESDIDFLVKQAKASRKLSTIRMKEIEESISRFETSASNRDKDINELKQQLVSHRNRIESINKYLKLFSESYQKLAELQYTDEELFHYFERELLPNAGHLALLDHESELQHVNQREISKQTAKLARDQAYEMGVGELWDSWYVDRLEQRSEFSVI